MGLILDTSAIVAWERAVEAGGTVDLEPDIELVLPAIVWAEVLAGVRLAGTPVKAARRLARLEAIRRVTGVEPFDERIAAHYADIFAELHQQGSLIPQNDLQVAATARCFGLGVLVGPRDEAHFRRVDGLEVRVLREGTGNGSPG